jgi:hypothetical protein
MAIGKAREPVNAVCRVGLCVPDFGGIRLVLDVLLCVAGGVLVSVGVGVGVSVGVGVGVGVGDPSVQCES